MGYGEEEAERLARDVAEAPPFCCVGYPAVSARIPTGFPSMRTESCLSRFCWQSHGMPRLTVTAQRWKVWRESDPQDFEARLLALARVADPPIQQIDSVWTVVAPVVLFEMLAPLVAERDLKALKAACTNVLGEVDPAVDLPVDERQYASLHGKTLKHSSWLRDGLTQTLLLIAVRGEDARLACSGGPQRFANGVISELPGLAKDHRLMASLQSQFPLLMEAAPDPLLQALGQLLEGDGQRIVPIFAEGGLLGPNSYHTGLLWALESLAWDPEYFARAVDMLVRLAKIDPGGKLANRPESSLHEIFLPWLPSTNAPYAMRMRVLDSVLRTEPDIGWNVLASLLPDFHGASMSTHKPRWRDAGASEKEDVTRKVIFDTYVGVIERALVHASDDPARWSKVIRSMPSFDPDSLQKAQAALRELAGRVQSAQTRFELWTALRDDVNRHRKFASADWSYSPEMLSTFDGIIEQFKPADIVEQNLWLFDKYDPDLPQPWEEETYGDAEELRRRALAQIVSEQGLDGVLRLAQRAKIQGLAGVSAAQVISELPVLQELLERSLAIGEPLDVFSGALSSVALERQGAPWGQWVLEGPSRGWSSQQMSNALSRWPDVPATWEAIATLGSEVEHLYWTQKPMLPVRDPTLRTAATRKYVEVGRAAEALARFAHHADELPSDVLVELLDATLQELAKRTTPVSSNFGYELEEVFDALRGRTDVERIEIARREYVVLPLLDRRDGRLTLHDLLTSEPALFVEVLSDVFRAASQPREEEVTDDQSRRATMGYRLLQSLRTIPGLQKDGSLDADVMRRWVIDVRELAARVDRSTMADLQIGELLAYSPFDADGAWPHRAVRDLLEELRSDDIQRGIVTEQLNKRGAYWKAMFEGGVQERGLAETARGWAKASEHWPRTNAMLMAVTRMWEEQAERADRDAAKSREKFG